MRSRDKRFKGVGNFSVGDNGPRHRAWKLVCSTCQGIKLVVMPDRNLPPDVIVKKFTQAGWYVGRRPEDDICNVCVSKRRERKEREERAAVTTPVMNGINETVALDRERKFIASVHRLLIDGLIQEAVQRIEAHLPTWPLLKRQSKVKAEPSPPPKIEVSPAETEFSQWLDSLDKQHKKQSYCKGK